MLDRCARVARTNHSSQWLDVAPGMVIAPRKRRSAMMTGKTQRQFVLASAAATSYSSLGKHHGFYQSVCRAGAPYERKN
jgi:hypothetical protein